MFFGAFPVEVSLGLSKLLKFFWKVMSFVTTLNSVGKRDLQIGRYVLSVKFLQSITEALILAGAFVLANLLRFDFNIPPEEVPRVLIQLPIVVILEIFALRAVGAHKFIWRYTSLRDATTIAAALSGVFVVILTFRFLYSVLPQYMIVPFSISVLNLIVAFVGVLGIRMIRRDIHERTTRSKVNGAEKKPVILVGAGQAGVLTLAEILRRGDIDMEVKAFVDDDPAKLGAIINGVKVVGSTDKLPELVKELDIDHVIISIAQANRNEFQKILGICQEIPIKVRTIPGLYELLQGNVTVSRIRDIELEDLLGRFPVMLEQGSINRFLSEKVVMVTGAGGSIGSELVRQLAHADIKQLILVERSEYALFQIEREITRNFPDFDMRAVIGDICDRERMDNIFSRYRPNVVFHAAAHKHVPLMEINASEALKNNVLGTKMVAELAGQYASDAFVLISSDKAVFPTSIMGATKRLAELVIQDLDREYETRFLAVRFGNVIGSNGSVIPTFREQIKNGGPVEVTHPQMTRYFMTIPEATQLVLQAGAIGKGGDIMILDMGRPVRILDLARETIRLSGLRPDVDIQIKFVGMRPGEKLAEVLESDAERLLKTSHPKIFVGKIAPYPRVRMRDIINNIPGLCNTEDDSRIREFLSSSLPEAKIGAKSPEGKNGHDHFDKSFNTSYTKPATV